MICSMDSSIVVNIDNDGNAELCRSFDAITLLEEMMEYQCALYTTRVRKKLANASLPILLGETIEGRVTA
jgi:hypothetical protein